MNTKQLAVEELDEVSVVTLGGDLDAEFIGQLRSLIDKLIDKGATNVVIDMTNASFLSLSMISALIGCIGQLRQYGGKAKLCAVSHPVHQSFDILGAGRYIDVFEDRMGALLSNPPEIRRRLGIRDRRCSKDRRKNIRSFSGGDRRRNERRRVPHSEDPEDSGVAHMCCSWHGIGG